MQKQTKPKPLGLSMAKLVLVVAIIASLGTVLGVAGWVVKNKPVVSPVPDQTINYFVGTLVPGGVECRLFQLDDGTIYSLEGSRNLTGNFNNGDKVSIKGNFVEKSYCMQGKKVINLSEINYTKDETSNWKTYKNEEYGFEFQYPSSWSVRQNYFMAEARIPALEAFHFCDDAKNKNCIILYL